MVSLSLSPSLYIYIYVCMCISCITLMTLDYGNYGFFLIMSNAVGLLVIILFTGAQDLFLIIPEPIWEFPKLGDPNIIWYPK